MKALASLVVFAAFAFLSFAQLEVRAATVRTVALTGQQMPGFPEGTVFGDFPGSPGNVVLNNAGQTAFFAGNGIWSEGGGSLHLAAAVGQQAPGLPEGATYLDFGDSWQIVISDTGTTAFPANVAVQGVPTGGLWSSGPGGSALIALRFQQAAGTPDGVQYYIDAYSSYPSIVLNDAGQAAFSSQLAGSSSGSGFWAQRGGHVELVARTGDHAPGTPDGVNFTDFNFYQSLALNRSGQTAFQASTTPGFPPPAGIWSGGSGSLALVARNGDQAPGMPDGAVFTSVGRPDLNNSGRTAFGGSVTGGGVDATNDVGIWLGTPGNLSLAVRAGDHAPGTPSGVIFASLNVIGFGAPALNDAGQIAFFGTLSGPGINSTNNLGLWSGAPGSQALVARLGDHPPGTEDGVVFNGFVSVGVGFPQPILMLNAAGQAAFLATFTGSGTSGRGIWATDRGGAMQLIARTGDPLEVAPGDFRTVSELGFLDYKNLNIFPTGNADGRPSAFNNLGQLAFEAEFTDGTSGVFVSNVVAVPEPSAITLTAFAAVGALIVRRWLWSAERLKPPDPRRANRRRIRVPGKKLTIFLAGFVPIFRTNW